MRFMLFAPKEHGRGRDRGLHRYTSERWQVYPAMAPRHWRLAQHPDVQLRARRTLSAHSASSAGSALGSDTTSAPRLTASRMRHLPTQRAQGLETWTPGSALGSDTTSAPRLMASRMRHLLRKRLSLQTPGGLR